MSDERTADSNHDSGSVEQLTVAGVPIIIEQMDTAPPASEPNQEPNKPAAEAKPAKTKGKRGRKKKTDGDQPEAKSKGDITLVTDIKAEPDTRFVGWRHRIKKTAEGEARPTQVAIFTAGEPFPRRIDIEDEQGELYWIDGIFPTKYRKLGLSEEIGPSQDVFEAVCKANKLPVVESDPRFHLLFLQLCKIKELKKGEEPPEGINESQVIRKDPKSGKDLKRTLIISEIPIVFEGLKPGDTNVMTLGGSGDRLAFALSRRSEELTKLSGKPTTVFRTPPRVLKEHRDAHGRDKETDSVSVVEIFVLNRQAFYECDVRDRERINVIQLVRDRRDVLKARMGCEQRLQQRVIGQVFVAANLYPEGTLEDRYRDARASDRTLNALLLEEATADKDLGAAIEQVDVYQRILSLVDGVGPITGAELFAAIGDIRKFQVHPDAMLISNMRAQARAKLDEGKFLDEALEVIVGTKNVSRKDPSKLWADLPRLLRFVAQIKGGKGQAAEADKLVQAANLVETVTELFTQEAIDAVVNQARKLCVEGQFLEEIFQVRDRKIMDRKGLFDSVFWLKKKRGKDAEAAAVQRAIDLFQAISRIKYKAVQRSMAKLRAYCGVHVLRGGKYKDVPPEHQFPRTRRGVTCNWNRMARQRLFLLVADQFNKRPATVWGQRLRVIKLAVRAKHPVPVKTPEGKTRYSDGHVHKTSIWKCASSFVDWLYEQWMALEEEHRRKAAAAASGSAPSTSAS